MFTISYLQNIKNLYFCPIVKVLLTDIIEPKIISLWFPWRLK